MFAKSYHFHFLCSLIVICICVGHMLIWGVHHTFGLGLVVLILIEVFFKVGVC